MTDLEIVKRIRAGHIHAYSDMMERYQEKLYAAVYRCVKQEDPALEITESSFVEAYAHLGNIEHESDYLYYLFRTMLSRIKLGYTSDDDQAVAVYDQIAQLERPQRSVIMLRYVYGLTYEQIAEKLDRNMDDILSDLASAREQITGYSGCEAYRKKIQAYLDNELMRMERMEVEVHAEECNCCAETLEQVHKVFGDDIYVEMPHSIISSALERVKEEYDWENGIEEGESKREQLTKKLEKNQNLRTWILVACVLLFGLLSWLFSLTAENNLGNASSSSGQSGSISTVTDPDEFSQSLAQEIKKADAIFIEFGFSRAGVTEEVMIMMFADYIAAQPAQEYQGVAVSGSLGSITMKPDLGYSITITSEHRLLVDTGEEIWELQTTREKLLDTLRALGI